MADDRDNLEGEGKTARVKKGDRVIEIDKSAPGIQGERREFGLAGDARPDRAPGESGRGDLSDTDRVGSHGQGLNSPDEREPRGIASKGGGEMSSQGIQGDEGVDREQHAGKRGLTREPEDD